MEKLYTHFFKFNSSNFKMNNISNEEKEKYKVLVLLIYDEFGLAGKYELTKGLHMLKKFVGCKTVE